MKVGLYVIRDEVAETINQQVYLFKADAAATRFFADVAGEQSRGNVLARHVEDFSLYRLGFLDEDTLEVTLEQPAIVVMTGAQYKAMEAGMKELAEAEARR